jgi:hypothetical protein
MNNQWNPFAYPPGKVVKSIWAFFLPGAAILLNSYTTPDKEVGTRDFIVALLTSVVTSYTVFAATNKEPQNDPRGGGLDEVGDVSIIGVIGVVLLAVGVLALLGIIGISVTIAVLLCIAGLVCLVVGYRGGWG